MKRKSRPDKKGFKRVELYEFFGSEEVEYNDIDAFVGEYHKLKFLRRNRDGWFKLTPKGREHHQKLQEAK